MQLLNPKFIDQISKSHGAKGDEWIKSLPVLVADIVRQHSLTNIEPFSNIRYNYVASCTLHRTECVLKIGFSGKEIQQEIDALRLFEGHGGPEIIDSSKKNGTILMSRVIPGTMLLDVDNDRDRTMIAAKLMKKLHTEQYGDFPRLLEWTEEMLGRKLDFVSDEDKIKIREVFERLKGLDLPEYIIHGDYHHENILLNGDKWCIIDPKGYKGPREWECGVYLFNNCSVDIRKCLEERMKIFSDVCGLKEENILLCAILATFMSLVWLEEDGPVGDDNGCLGILKEQLRMIQS